MYTQCPFCQTVFGVAPQHLAAADGQVRCGHCQQLFNAEENLLIDLPEAEQEAVPEAPAAADDHSMADSADVDEEQDEAPQLPIFRQTALSPPTQEDEETLNAIFADLDTRLVRMKEKTTASQEQEDDAPAPQQRIDPTINLNWDNMEADGFYPPPPMKNRGPQEPYIDPDDLDALDKLAFEELEDAATQLAESSKGPKPVGNWEEVDDYRATEFVRDTAASLPQPDYH